MVESGQSQVESPAVSLSQLTKPFEGLPGIRGITGLPSRDQHSCSQDLNGAEDRGSGPLPPGDALEESQTFFESSKEGERTRFFENKTGRRSLCTHAISRLRACRSWP